MVWTTYRTSEKYQINSPFFCYPISLPSLNMSRSLLNFDSTRQLEILGTVLSVVSYSALCLFSWWKHSGWRNKGITFEKKGKEEHSILITTIFITTYTNLSLVICRLFCSVTWKYFPIIMFSGSLFSGSGSTSLFGQQQQQQTTGSLFGQKTGGLFGTPTSSTTSTGFGTGFGAGGTTGLFGQSSTGQTVSFILQEC